MSPWPHPARHLARFLGSGWGNIKRSNIKVKAKVKAKVNSVPRYILSPTLMALRRHIRPS
jgi:hypothetical protein